MQVPGVMITCLKYAYLLTSSTDVTPMCFNLKFANNVRLSVRAVVYLSIYLLKGRFI